MTKRLFLSSAMIVLLAACAGAARALELDVKKFNGLQFQAFDGTTHSAAGLGWELLLAKDGPELRAENFSIGKVGGTGLMLKETNNDWTTATAVYETPATPEASPAGAAGTLSVSISRLTPAAIVRGRNQITLFAGDRAAAEFRTREKGAPPTSAAIPRYFATSDGRVRPIAELAHPLADGLGQGWILFWWGEADAGVEVSGFLKGRESRVADVPTLVVLSDKIASIQATGPVDKLAKGPGGGMSGLGVRFDFGRNEARLAVLPLYGEPVYLRGEQLPSQKPAAPKTNWKDKVPDAVLARAKFWAEHLAEVPVAIVGESVQRDEKADTVTIRTRFAFERVRAGGQRLAPLPASLAAAQKAGMKISVPGEFVITELATPFGPYSGVGGDTASYTLAGLGKYVFAERIVGDRPVPRRLQDTINAEADKILAAGILAPPLYFLRHGPQDPEFYHQFRERFVFSNPGYNLYVLAQLADTVDSERREKLISLLKAWRAKYPPETVAHQPHDDARRERSELYAPRDVFQRWPAKDQNFHLVNRIVPVENLYYLAEYCRVTGERPDKAPREISAFYLAHTDWASGGFFRWGARLPKAWSSRDHLYGRNHVSELNQLLSAMIGQIRLARLADDAPAEAEAWHALARSAMLRLVVAKTPFRFRMNDEEYKDIKFLHVPGVQRYFGECDERGMWGEMYLVRHGNGVLLPYIDLMPEVARFLQDHARGEVQQFCDNVSTHVPDWYRTYCDVMWVGEQAHMYPSDADQVFACHAFVLQDTDPFTMFKWCDIPWVPTGDMYYIRKLVETHRAYRGWKWK